MDPEKKKRGRAPRGSEASPYIMDAVQASPPQAPLRAVRMKKKKLVRPRYERREV